MSWGPTDWIAAIAAAIALLSLAFSVAQYLRARHEEVVRALQGDKETVGYIAYRLGEGDGRFPRSRRRRREILMALCLAAVFEKSGRSRTLIYRALSKGRRLYGGEVTGIVDDIQAHFEAYAEVSKLEKGRKRLEQLRQALSLDPGSAE